MISILIISDTRVYREGLASYLGQSGKYCIKTVNHSYASKCNSDSPDVFLVDFALSGSVHIIKEISTLYPNSSVIVLGLNDNGDDYICCAQAGAVGFVPCDASLSTLQAIISSSMSGQTNCHPRFVRRFVQQLFRIHSAVNTFEKLSKLTDREQQIIELMSQGLTNKQIARNLSICPSTVKVHVSKILEKLKIHRRGEVAALLHNSITTSPASRFGQID